MNILLVKILPHTASIVEANFLVNVDIDIFQGPITVLTRRGYQIKMPLNNGDATALNAIIVKRCKELVADVTEPEPISVDKILVLGAFSNINIAAQDKYEKGRPDLDRDWDDEKKKRKEEKYKGKH
jgi:hypothetical protein